MIKIIFALVFSTLLSSCVSTRIGTIVNDCSTPNCLRRNLGPPNYVIKNGNEGVIWIYNEIVTKSAPGTIILYGDDFATYTNPSTYEYEKYVKFWINGNYIYRWETKGYDLKKISTIGWILIFAGSIGAGIALGLTIAY